MKTIFDWFIDKIVYMFSHTIGEMDMPFVIKKFPIDDYFKIEKKIRGYSDQFVIGLNSTYGSGSNILIKIAQRIGVKYSSISTHAFMHIGVRNGYKHRVVEAVGEGIREKSLLYCTGQKDLVLLYRLHPNRTPPLLHKYATEFLHAVLDRDERENIEYDDAHDLNDIEKLDCAETLFHALKYGYQKTGHRFPLQPVMRGGKETWTPAEIEQCNLFIKIYDSRNGAKW